VIERVIVRTGTYHDSAFLMRVARELARRPGIGEATVLMGTPMNRELLAGAGFAAAALAPATPMDMIVALRATAEALATAEAELDVLLEGESAPPAAGAAPRDRSLPEALAAHPQVTLVSVAVPGPYAAFTAQRALDAGRHIFLFSNNVPLAEELALKRRAVGEGLLVMGPDCGTAIIAGVGLGFANRVPRGPVGLVGASGTGIQEVSCQLAHLGCGVSQAIGTGSRDLTADVNGLMTELGARVLADDPATTVIALIAKHPAEAVARRMHEVLRGLGKPVVVRYLGKPAPPSEGPVRYAVDLDDAARQAAALARGAAPPAPGAAPGIAMRAAAILGGRARLGGRLCGLFGGGSLAAEAALILAGRGVRTTEPDRPLATRGPLEGEGHLIVDTGEDFYTVGKPHPMVDQTVRCALLTKTAADPAVDLVLLDLVLGDGSHQNPAPELAAALAAGRAARGAAPLVVLASVTGTDADPQNAARQCALLAEAGVEVTRSATEAAHLAAALLAGAKGGAQ
jgi:succinyl-CoA synthetase alpha subunit